jgi:hypothetical protein
MSATISEERATKHRYCRTAHFDLERAVQVRRSATIGQYRATEAGC